MTPTKKAMRTAMKRSIKEAFAPHSAKRIATDRLLSANHRVRTLMAENDTLRTDLTQLRQSLCNRRLTAAELIRITEALHRAFPEESTPIAAAPDYLDYAVTISETCSLILRVRAGESASVCLVTGHTPIVLADGASLSAADALAAVAAYDRLAGE
jgi:hypothetical protein